jgi:hypothetical protein
MVSALSRHVRQRRYGIGIITKRAPDENEPPAGADPAGRDPDALAAE